MPEALAEQVVQVVPVALAVPEEQDSDAQAVMEPLAVPEVQVALADQGVQEPQVQALPWQNRAEELL